MNDTKTQWEPTGLERFGHLEDKLFRMVEEFKAVRKDNDTLRSENGQLKEQIDGLLDNLAEFEKEREQLRERVEKALGLLATLEAK